MRKYNYLLKEWKYLYLFKEGGAQESGNGGEKESATEGSAKDNKCKLI